MVLPAAVTSLEHPWRKGPPAGTPTAAAAAATTAATTGGRGGGHLDDCSDAPLG